MEPEEVLAAAQRCVLALSVAGQPLLASRACWWDGEALWSVADATAADVQALVLDPACAIYARPQEPDGPGISVSGSARVHGLHDPVGLAFHSTAIGAALVALGLAHAETIIAYAPQVTRSGLDWLTRNRVVLRVVTGQPLPIMPSAGGDGVVPPLPGVIPSAVRRALAGVRDVVVAYDDGQLRLAPATWRAGFALDFGPRRVPPAGARIGTLVEDSTAGAVLYGEVDGDAHLTTDRVSWWDGLHTGQAEVAAMPPGGVELPE